MPVDFKHSSPGIPKVKFMRDLQVKIYLTVKASTPIVKDWNLGV
jgi:hypothetical protein